MSTEFKKLIGVNYDKLRLLFLTLGLHELEHRTRAFVAEADKEAAAAIVVIS